SASASASATARSAAATARATRPARSAAATAATAAAPAPAAFAVVAPASAAAVAIVAPAGRRRRVELGEVGAGVALGHDLALVHLLRHAMQIAAQRVDLGAGLADDDPRPGRVDVDLDLVGVLADRDLRQARVRELADDVAADRHVLGQVVGEVALVEPVRLP